MSTSSSDPADSWASGQSASRHVPADAILAGRAGSPPQTPTLGGRLLAANTAQDPFTGKVLGDYELLHEIARGGMGVVYRARQRGLNRLVALKMVLAGRFASGDDLQRFQIEARAAAALDHPNIVPIYDIGQHDGHAYFTMAYIEGESLSDRVKNRGLPTPQEAARLVLGVAEAIEYAHSRGIIHRDLKPDNILLDGQGRPRVTDFGLAKQVDGESSITGTGMIMGTPRYMSPEQARGNCPVGPPADIHALGAILYFLLTKAPPFDGGSVTETLLCVVERAPVAPHLLNANAPPGLEAICLRCLEKLPIQRYPSAAAVVKALQAWLAGEESASSVCVPEAVGSLPTRCEPMVGGTQRLRPPTKVSRKGLRYLVLASAALGVLVAGLVALGFAGLLPGRIDSALSEHEGTSPAGVFGPLRQDFNIKVEMIGSRSTSGGLRQLQAGQQVAFKVTVERDAYVGIWAVDADGTIVQLFPNQYETDHFISAGHPRVVPGRDYVIEATLSGTTEYVRVVASTRPWDSLQGQREGPYTVFRTAAEKEEVKRHLRGLRLKEGTKKDAAVSENVVTYKVVASN